MVALGLVVGGSSTRVDDWFIGFGRTHRYFGTLLLFTAPLLLLVMLVGAVVVAAYRRWWRLAVVVALTPVVAIVVARVLKHLFGRERSGALAYPSGHVTVMVAVLGMVVLVVGARVWLIAAAVVFALLGLVGEALTYHYFTDTVGAALLATALVCLATRAAGLDRCQPRCDLSHSNG